MATRISTRQLMYVACGGVVLAAGLVLVISQVDHPPPQPEPVRPVVADQTPAASAPAAARNRVEMGPSGSYLVGVDVAPGEYRTDGPTPGSWQTVCFYSAAKDASGTMDSFITNNQVSGPGIFKVAAGQYVKIDGSCIWRRS